MEFNDVRLQYEQLSEEIDRAVKRVFLGGRYILGPAVQAFEEEFAHYSGAMAGIGVASGTDALRIALAALGVGPRDEVLVPAVSAPATAMAVTQLGAVPVFVDIRPDDFTMDFEDALEKRTRRTRAIVPVHLYGMPAHLKELSGIALPMVEDAAQAHGVDAPWGRCGAFGRAAAFSFYPTKNLGAYGDGGMILTSDAEIAERARLLRNYGQREQYSANMPGDNSRLDELHAAILSVKLRRLDEWNRRRRQIAEVYREGLRDLPLRMQAESGRSNYHLFVVVTPQRERLQRYLSELGIPTAVHYPIPLPRQKAFEALNPAQCRNADQLCAGVLSLPMHPTLDSHEVERVVDGVQAFFKDIKRGATRA